MRKGVNSHEVSLIIVHISTQPEGKLRGKEKEHSYPFTVNIQHHGPSQVVLVVKNPPANAGRCQRLGFNPWVNPLEKEILHFRIFAWRIPWAEEPHGKQSVGSHRVRYNWRNLALMHTYIIASQLVNLNISWRQGPSIYKFQKRDIPFTNP